MIHESGGYETYLQVDNASTTPGWVRIVGRSNVDDLTITVGPGETAFLGPFDSTPYLQPDRDLYIDFEEGLTGTVRACQAPRM